MPTVTFDIVYVFFVLSLERRRVLHVNVTAHPYAAWAAQQIVEAIGAEIVPERLIRDRDAIFGTEFHAGGQPGRPPDPHHAAFSLAERYAERWVGTLRRELLDHVIVLGERHLLRLVRQHVAYYNEDRPHMSLGGDAPRRASRRTTVRRRSPSHFRESADCTTAIRAPRDCRTSIWPSRLCGDRGLLVDPLMTARGVVVADVLGDDALEVPAVEDENVVGSREQCYRSLVGRIAIAVAFVTATVVTPATGCGNTCDKCAVPEPACATSVCTERCTTGHDVSSMVGGCLVWQCCVPDDAGVDASGPAECIDAGPAPNCTDADIEAKNYDQTCHTDSDCVLVGEGQSCFPCSLAYGPYGAIRHSALSQFEADVAKTPAGNLPVSCATGCTPSPLVCCRSGMCRADSQCANPADAGAAGADTGADAAMDGGPADAGSGE